MYWRFIFSYVYDLQKFTAISSTECSPLGAVCLQHKMLMIPSCSKQFWTEHNPLVFNKGHVTVTLSKRHKKYVRVTKNTSLSCLRYISWQERRFWVRGVSKPNLFFFIDHKAFPTQCDDRQFTYSCATSQPLKHHNSPRKLLTVIRYTYNPSSVVAASVKYTGRVFPVTLCVNEQLL